MGVPAVSMPLPAADSDVPVQVVGFAQAGGVERRLAGMGLTLGCEVRVLQREGGNLVVGVGHGRLALGYGLAQKILVRPL